MKRVEDGIPTDAGEDGRRMLAKDADRLCLVCRVTTTKLCVTVHRGGSVIG